MNIRPIRPPWKGTMTGRERFCRQMHFQSVDRSVNMEFGYWNENFQQWKLFRDNGITCNEEADAFFSFDPMPVVGLNGWMNPPFENRVVEIRGDKKVIINGDGLLAEVPLLDNNGKFNGQYELRLMVALDVGGAIKGQHFDIYQGIGPDAGHRAGWYNHYGRVWVLKAAPGAGNVFSG